MPSIRRGGATVTYSDTGAPGGDEDAPVVVFGHGLLFSGWMFHPQIEALRDRYRCVAIDWRGQGDSPPASGGYDMDSLTADAVAVIQSLGAGPVHYVGLSMGGFVGQRIGARHGHLLRSLTLLDTSPDRERPSAAVQDTALVLAYRAVGMTAFLLGQVVPIMFGPTFRRDLAGRAVIDEFARRLRGCDRRGISRAVLAVAFRKPIYAELERISVPTLVIVGEDDHPTPPDKARRIADRIPGARLEIVPAAGHSSTVEQPEAITALLQKFLAEV